MLSREQKLRRLDEVAEKVINAWHDRIKSEYVTEEDRHVLGLEPEVKLFHSPGNHLIKFTRERVLHVTYGLGVKSKDERCCIEASVNNKSSRFDYDVFANRLKRHYLRNRYERPWTDKEFAHFAYADLLLFDPRMGHSMSLDIRTDKADIVRLLFELNPKHEETILERPDLLQELVEDYCLGPLKRIYAETFRG